MKNNNVRGFTVEGAIPSDSQYPFVLDNVYIDGNGLEYVESSAIYNANGDPISPIIAEKYMKIYSIDKVTNNNFKKIFTTTHDRKDELYSIYITWLRCRGIGTFKEN